MPSAGDWKAVRLLTPCCLVLIPMAVSRARVLNTFSLGDGVAANLGVNVERQRLLLLGTATMLTAACVAIGGHIGFWWVGLRRILPGVWSGMPRRPVSRLCTLRRDPVVDGRQPRSAYFGPNRDSRWCAGGNPWRCLLPLFAGDDKGLRNDGSLC